MPDKARDGRVDDIRACIGCNQACIGHFHRASSAPALSGWFRTSQARIN